MHPSRLLCLLVLSLSLPLPLWAQTLPGVSAAMQEMIAKEEVAGAVTVVVTRDKILHLGADGYADIASKTPLNADTLFWIASMTKPITATAILMLQDEGKLNVADPVAKYLPEFAGLRTPSGKPANLTITQILTHTSGLGEAKGPAAQQAKTLADLVPIWLAAPMQYEPGEKWAYTQSGINAAARIVEVVSGTSFDTFLQKRLFRPLGMKNTTFYPSARQIAHRVTAYARNKESGHLEVVPPRPEFGPKDRPPQGNGGLYSTARDYARFCQMLLNGGRLGGHRYLSARAMELLSTPQTGSLPTGFFQGGVYGNHGADYGWGIGTCVLRTPHEGVASMLSPGSYGHGGAWGTQGLGGSGEGGRLCAHGAAFEPPEQRCQRGAGGFPARRFQRHPATLAEQAGVLLEPPFGGQVIGADALDLIPEPRRVVHLPHVHQLMQDQVVAHEVRGLDDPPVERDGPASRAGAPAGSLVTHAHATHGQPVGRCQLKHSGWQLPRGQAAQVRLDGCA